MFTKNFNSLPDSLIEASKKIMTESEKMSEASNEAPTINHLELSEEELNEIYVINSEVHGRIGRAGDKLRQAIGTTHNDSTHHRAIGAIDDLSHHLSVAHPEHKAILNQLKIAKQSLQRAANTSNNEEKAKHIETARQIHQKAQNLLRIHQNNNMQRLSQQGVNINSEFVPEEVNEAQSPEIKRLKQQAREARAAYRASQKPAAKKPMANPPPKAEPEDPEESARKHPIDRLRRIALSMKGGHFEYDNGEKHHISRDIAREIVKHYELPSEQGGLKPFQKEKIQSEITKSHDHLMKHYKSISGTNESSFEPEKNGREMIIEKKPKKSSINEWGSLATKALPLVAPYVVGAARKYAPDLTRDLARRAANDPGNVVRLPLPRTQPRPPQHTPAPTKPQTTPASAKPKPDLSNPWDIPVSDPERMDIRNIEKDAMAKLKDAPDQTKSYDMPDTSLSVRSIEMPRDQAQATAKSQAQASAQSQAVVAAARGGEKSTTKTGTEKSTSKKGKKRLPGLPSISLGRNNYAGALADPAGYSDVREAISPNMKSRPTRSSTIKNTIAARRAENLKTRTSHDPAGYQPAVDVQRAKDKEDQEVTGVLNRLQDVFGGTRIPRP